MASVATKVPFSDLCLVYEKIVSKRKGDDKRKALGDFIRTWRDFHIRLRKNKTASVATNDSFYPAMQLLLPQFDRERGPYGIKENTLAKLYIEILNLNKDGADAQKLLNYRLPVNAKADAGDFATVAYFVLKNRCPETGTLKIADVVADLDSIATCNAEKNRDGVKSHLLHLLRNTTAVEQKWLIRIIMKEMKLGLSDQSILNTFHPDAKDLYDVTNSLPKVCTSLHDPSLRLNEIDISMFAPFRPMLAERAPPNKIEKLMKHTIFFIETKHDGERVQLHKRGNEYKYYSRNGNEYTHNYGSDPTGGSLTPHLHNAFAGHVNECILDGEMMGYHVHAKCTGTKADNFDVKHLREGDDYVPCYHVFDILQINGKVISNLPLKERLAYLDGDRLFTPVEGRLQFPPRKEGKTMEDVIDALNIAIDNREEGIVIKDPNSVYKPNTRKGGWIKMKPEYVDGLMDELDLVIVGGYFGEGHRRGGMISHFLLAVAVPPERPGDHPSVFHSVAKVGSGYTMQELQELCRKLQDHLKPYDKRNPPKSVVLANGHKERPDLWVEPSESFIVQVKASEIVDSDKFKTGCTLRFPRVEKVRYDKPWHECMTVIDLQEMIQSAAGKLSSKHLNYDDDATNSPVKKRRTAAVTQRPLSVAAHFRGIDASTVETTSQLFRGKEFNIINGTESHPKQELERLILAHGGTVVQNPRPGTMCTLANHETIRVKNIMKAGVHDVVHCEWLLRCLLHKMILQWAPLDMFHASPPTAQQLSQDYDRHGDSYKTDITITELRKIFTNVKAKIKMDTFKMAEVEQEYFPNTSQLGLFRLCKIYLDIREDLELTELELRFYGASFTADVNDERLTHVVLQSNLPGKTEHFQAVNRRRGKKFHLVTKEWVSRCIEKGVLVNEKLFHP